MVSDGTEFWFTSETRFCAYRVLWMCWQGTLLSKGTCRNFEEIPLTWLLTIRKSLSSVRQVQALGGAFGVKYPLPLQTSCDYGVLFDDNLNVYVEAEERLLVTHAVEQEGATADNFISRSRKIKIVRWATCRLSNGSVGSWSTFTQLQIHVHLRPSFMEGEIRMCQLGLSFLLDSKLFLSHGRLCMWTRVENGGRSLLARITIIQCSYVRDLASSLRFPTKKKAISLSAGLHEIRCSNRQSSAASNLGQGMRDQYKSSIHCCWQKAVNTSVFQKASITV